MMPHPLDGVWAKIRRADELIGNLASEIAAFIGENAFQAISQPDPQDPRQHVVSVTGPETPLKFSVLAGEIIHHCRSALDHLIWQLVLANGGKPNHKHEFPICEKPGSFKNACEQKKLEGLASTALAIIESLQPFHNPKGPQWHPLWVLHDMDRIDKHRLLNVVVAQASVNALSIDTGFEGNTDLIRIHPPKWPTTPTPAGVEVLRLEFAQPRPLAKIDGAPRVEVAFETYGPVTKQPVIHCVTELKKVTVGTIMRFVSELKRPAEGS